MKRFGDLNPTLRGFLVIAAIAGIVFVLNLEQTLVSLSLIIQIIFFIAIAVVVYMFWRDRLRLEIATWSRRPQVVFYGAAALVLLDFGAYFWPGRRTVGLDAFAFVVVLMLCGFAMFRTWRDARSTYA
jgi:hypothetical protein